MIKIRHSRHDFGTAEVSVECNDNSDFVTGYSRNGGHRFTVEPLSFYVEDEDDYGFRDRVTLLGLLVKKDGTAGHRQIRLGPVARRDIPDNVWAELTAMRPDLVATFRVGFSS